MKYNYIYFLYNISLKIFSIIILSYSKSHLLSSYAAITKLLLKIILIVQVALLNFPQEQ